MDGDDSLDLRKLTLTPEIAETLGKAKAKTEAQRRRQQFVKVPLTWLERLRVAKHASTFKVAHYLLFEHWKRGGRPVRLSNIAMTEAGVSRWQKWRALTELERLKLIRVKRRSRKSPMITVLV
jgi:hypothetical protein